MRLDEVAQELYAVPPGEFVAVRSERVRQAKEAGDRTLANSLAKLRRPTQSAWLVNLLWRERRELVEELLAVGEEFRGQQLTRQRLQELTARRRELLHRLQADAQRLSSQAGAELTGERAREVEATLAAAVADPDAAAQVRSGRLVTALSYSGLGPELQFTFSPTRPTPATDATAPDGEAPAGDGRGDGQRPADEATDGRRTADRTDNRTDDRTDDDRATDDRAAQDRAAQERERRRATAKALVDTRSAEWQAAVRARDELARRRDTLNHELRRVQRELDRTERELSDAERKVDSTAERLEQAKSAFDG